MAPAELATKEDEALLAPDKEVVSLSKILDNPNLPPPPALALQIVDAARRPDCEIKEILNLLRQDPGLCGKVLQTVNSSLFALPRAVASLDRTAEYAIELDPDFANFYPAVPYPGTDLYAKAKRDGLLRSEDWTRMEYSYYLMSGNGLDEPTVMGAINRAKRRFYLRPSYLARHSRDVLRLAVTKWSLAWHVGSRMLFGTRIANAEATHDAAERPA